MTNEDAIKVLKDYWYYLPELDFAAKVAIHAIEKQIAKSVVRVTKARGTLPYIAHHATLC